MKIVDANVLRYAVNSARTHHEASRRWLDGALSGSDTVGLAWTPLLAFVRLSTKIGLFPSPLPPADAMRQVVEWTTAPGATTIGPTARHGDVLHGLLAQLGTGGNLVDVPVRAGHVRDDHWIRIRSLAGTSQRAQSSKMATALVQPADAACTFTGKQHI